MPFFFIDLNLDQVIFKINSLRKNYDVRQLYYMVPETAEDMRLRRRVLDVVKKDNLFKSLVAYSDSMKKVRDYLELREAVSYEPQKNILYVSAAAIYYKAIAEVTEAMQENQGDSVLTDVTIQMNEYIHKSDIAATSAVACELYEKLSRLSYRLRIKRDSFIVKNVPPGEGEVKSSDYMNRLLSIFPNATDTGFESPFSHRKGLSHMETCAYEAMARDNPELFKCCADFALTGHDIFERAFFDFEYELQFYISFVSFEKYMMENGFEFCTPYEDKEMKLNGVYDVALALKLFKHESPVIDNDVTVSEEEQFLVVTGPNQGGKTTFARSVGQLIYFNLMGLDVPGSSAGLPFYRTILTHFSVEESMETGQGKLKEELSRLAPMMKENAAGCFVILNELFTTAATYDAAIMGERVMKHFMDNSSKGIYVTHIKELASVSGAVSLVAVCDELDYHRRLYKLVRKPAEGKGYAGTLVEKYALDKKALAERFKALELY